jgi:hypothetical protein
VDDVVAVRGIGDQLQHLLRNGVVADEVLKDPRDEPDRDPPQCFERAVPDGFDSKFGDEREGVDVDVRQ